MKKMSFPQILFFIICGNAILGYIYGEDYD